MSLLYIFLTILMVLDCMILILLVLMQLPKKEAGAGAAFGAGATDALFGAGSGNVLTHITKWAAGIFFGLAVLMAMVAAHNHTGNGADILRQELGKTSGVAPVVAPATLPSTAMPSNGLLQAPPLSKSLIPAAPATTTIPATNKAPAK